MSWAIPSKIAPSPLCKYPLSSLYGVAVSPTTLTIGLQVFRSAIKRLYLVSVFLGRRCASSITTKSGAGTMSKARCQTLWMPAKVIGRSNTFCFKPALYIPKSASGYNFSNPSAPCSSSSLTCVTTRTRVPGNDMASLIICAMIAVFPDPVGATISGLSPALPAQ